MSRESGEARRDPCPRPLSPGFLRSLAIALVAAVTLAATDVAAQPSPPPAAEDPWRSLLASRVNDLGEVAYDQIGREDRARLDRVLAEVAAQNVAGMDRDHAVAFWLNGYHAMVMAAVVAGERPNTMPGRARMYHWYHRQIGGYRLTLDDVRFILNGFASKDPRIHLAIYDGTRSGPRLARAPYRADELDRQLAEAARRFVNDSRNFQVKPEVGRVALSRVFEWHRVDYEREAGTLARFLQRYAQDVELIRALESPVVGFESLPYDWRLAGSE